MDSGQPSISLHAQQERLEDDLDISDVEAAITHGEILEDYPHDPRGASCLVAGQAGIKSVHAVLGWARKRDGSERVLRVITVYRPQPPKWTDSRTRGGKP
jgi:Domain of unknown function (DUF4258)